MNKRENHHVEMAYAYCVANDPEMAIEHLDMALKSPGKGPKRPVQRRKAKVSTPGPEYIPLSWRPITEGTKYTGKDEVLCRDGLWRPLDGFFGPIQDDASTWPPRWPTDMERWTHGYGAPTPKSVLAPEVRAGANSVAPNWKRKRIENPALLKLYHRAHLDCEVCGQEAMPTPHHLISVGLGGCDVVENMLSLCANCHIGNDGFHPLGVRKWVERIHERGHWDRMSRDAREKSTCRAALGNLEGGSIE